MNELKKIHDEVHDVSAMEIYKRNHEIFGSYFNEEQFKPLRVVWFAGYDINTGVIMVLNTSIAVEKASYFSLNANLQDEMEKRRLAYLGLVARKQDVNMYRNRLLELGYNVCNQWGWKEPKRDLPPYIYAPYIIVTGSVNVGTQGKLSSRYAIVDPTTPGCTKIKLND